MMKIAATLLVIGSAAAFAPSAQQSRGSSAIAAYPFDGEIGAQAPVSSQS